MKFPKHTVHWCLAGVAMLALSLPVFAESEEDSASEAVTAPVAADAESIRPIQPGSTAPDVTVRNLEGESVSLHDKVLGETTLVVFYRGGWCPYCTRHLAELAGMQEELSDRGVQVMAFSPDSPEKLRETAAEHEFPYTLYSDNSFAAARAFGVAFAVDDPTDERLRGFGIDLGEWSGSEARVLPVPAVFLIADDGTILFTHADPDYRERLSAAELRQALEPVDAGGAGTDGRGTTAPWHGAACQVTGKPYQTTTGCGINIYE